MRPNQQRALAVIYRDAAGERIIAAGQLYEAGQYVEANYLAGLAVECILRAYRMMIDPEFDSRHDIAGLYKLAKFSNIVPPNDIEAVSAAIGDVSALWSNDHRFLSKIALRKRWVKQNLFRGIKGDFVKEQTRQLLNSSLYIVNTGVEKWKSSFGN
jgi:hypothetical protein